MLTRFVLQKKMTAVRLEKIDSICCLMKCLKRGYLCCCKLKNKIFFQIETLTQSNVYCNYVKVTLHGTITHIDISLFLSLSLFLREICIAMKKIGMSTCFWLRLALLLEAMLPAEDTAAEMVLRCQGCIIRTLLAD